jgi:four helix bundle protein
MFKFEELRVYQKSLDIIDEVYNLTEKFPRKENFVLTSQLLRAVNSIALNIAEGANSTDKVFNNHLRIASDSLKECIVCLTKARRRNYISIKEDENLREHFLVVAKMLTNLKKYLNKK